MAPSRKGVFVYSFSMNDTVGGDSFEDDLSLSPQTPSNYPASRGAAKPEQDSGAPTGTDASTVKRVQYRAPHSQPDTPGNSSLTQGDSGADQDSDVSSEIDAERVKESREKVCKWLLALFFISISKRKSKCMGPMRIYIAVRAITYIETQAWRDYSLESDRLELKDNSRKMLAESA